ncbi:unnamed protein product, partial [Cylicocyclus nassatus]
MFDFYRIFVFAWVDCVINTHQQYLILSHISDFPSFIRKSSFCFCFCLCIVFLICLLFCFVFNILILLLFVVCCR